MGNIRIRLLFALGVLLVLSAFTMGEKDTLSMKGDEERISEVYVADFRDNKKCAISYTFDDGLREHYTLLLPQLERVGFKATFWIYGKGIDTGDSQENKSRMTWAQVKEMADKGHEISNHSWSHANLKHLGIEGIRMEVEKNDSIIEAMVGKRPVTFCYPYNSFNEEVLQIASESRVGTRTEQYGIGGEVSKSTVESLDKWVDGLLASGSWGVTMIHGMTYEYDHFYNPEILWEHLKRVKARESEIWIATFAEVSAYVKERKSVELEVVKNKSSYKVTPHLQLDSNLFTEPLTMVVKNGKSKMTVKQDGKVLPVKLTGENGLFDFNPYGGVITISF